MIEEIEVNRAKAATEFIEWCAFVSRILAPGAQPGRRFVEEGSSLFLDNFPAIPALPPLMRVGDKGRLLCGMPHSTASKNSSTYLQNNICDEII